ncbi:hypothetical protein P154DRAFT_585907 [Amniculicola lignicola CBS 123094]|uniref:Uncharacterized protein n=1 Tax=Amniculicola lignicola CBS 123094 TaxID=1392246 RepID=A0A6A5VXP4_9PLEO|nr:hypothetical protein P154DRAFT_585907 [Amniculicola lignicola CBS 123094]
MDPMLWRIPSLISAVFSSIFVLLLPFRVSKLYSQSIKVLPKNERYLNLVMAATLSVIQLGRLMSVASESSTRHDIQIPLLASVAAFLASLGLCPLLYLEHMRSIRPADWAVIYVLVTAITDAIELEASLRSHPVDVYSSLIMIAITLKLVLLATESRGMKKSLRMMNSPPAPEQTAGVLNRTFFWWINEILVQGYKGVLVASTLPPVTDKLSSSYLRRRALIAWAKRTHPTKATTLPMAICRSVLPQFLAPVIPRLVLIGLRYAQPVLIRTAINALKESGKGPRTSGEVVVLMAIFVYGGIAVSKAIYRNRMNRVKLMIKGAVIGLINHHSLRQVHTGGDDGKVVTLMGTDAETISGAADMFHEIWAQIIEVGIGMTMLAYEAGWVWPVPLVIIFFCSRVSHYLAKNLQSKQNDWTVATQKRLSLAISLLNSIKSLKMTGFTSHVEALLERQRAKELDMAKKVRWMMVAYNASANALGLFSPIVTFALYALITSFKGKGLDVETAFTVTALLGLVTHPANMIMSTVPQVVGSLAAFNRVQQYLLQPQHHDNRIILETSQSEQQQATRALVLDNVTIKPYTSRTPILTGVSFAVERGSTFMCCGPVGSGKTVLARAIMGEVTVVEGTVSVSTRHIASCDQSPWLPRGTFKNSICGFSPFVQTWYDDVIRLCCLEEDLLAFPNGDETMIGSRGINLSGGQRQRVAIARAVYARAPIILLDDSFSALDGKTERTIVENLLGPEGYFKKNATTVVYNTNSGKSEHYRDKGNISYQGMWKELKQDIKSTVKYHTDETEVYRPEPQLQVDVAAQNQQIKAAEALEDSKRETGDTSLYGYYIKAMGLRNFLILVSCTSCYAFFVTFPQYWLQKWTEAPAYQMRYYIGGYLISSLLAWISTNGSMWSTHIRVAQYSGVELHRRLLSIIVCAPFSFFSPVDAGSILNRFGQDMQLVDKQLPPAVLSILNQIFKLTFQTVLLFSAQKLMTLTLPLCIFILYFVQKVYLRTSRQLRLLDLESQSAVYASFLESVEGLTTIRSLGWTKQIEQATTHALDTSQQPAYILLCLQQWLSLVLDLVVAAVATGLILMAFMLRGSTSAGQMGMALNIVLVANTTLIGLVTSWTNMEISLGAISRLRTLEANTPSEENMDNAFHPAENWPSSGHVDFEHVTVVYNGSDNEVAALQDLTLSVKPGEQMVVRGRTGSGKSTLLAAALRLVDIRHGNIFVDSVNLQQVSPSLIRRKCFITIAQDPFVIDQASLRFNLNPTTSLSDQTIVAALRRTQLWSHFLSSHTITGSNSVPIHRLLGSPLSSFARMSVGQLQLFALTRAVLQRQSLQSLYGSKMGQPIKPVILLDEATSSVDPETDSLMHNIIREEFRNHGHTVIAITHRMGAVAEGDGSQGVHEVVLSAR